MKKAWLATPVFLVALAAGSYGLFIYLRPSPLPNGLLYGNGHIEGTEVRVGSEVTGRVIESRLVINGKPTLRGAIGPVDHSAARSRLRLVEDHRVS